MGWGVVLAALLQGVPRQADGHVAGVSHLATPFAATAGLAMVALVAVHGATFLALRLSADAAAVVGRTARRLVPVALTAVALATVVGLLSARVRDAVQRPAVAVLLPVLLVGGAAGGPRGAGAGGGRGGLWPPPARPWRCRWCWSGRLSGPTCWCPRPTRAPR